MTTEEISSLSGRDLDAAVAVTLFGWKRGNKARGQHEWLKPASDPRYHRGYEETPVLTTYSDWPGLPLVLAWLREHEWWLTIQTHAFGEGANVSATRLSPYAEIPELRADTLPVAICQVALLAAQKGTVDDKA